VAYDGFEPSGRMHIAQGLLRSMNVNRLTSAGVKFVFYVADYFALMNNKMGGDIEKIRDCGRYMIEIWKACGMDLTNVEFVWASDFIDHYASKYWFNVLQIATRNNITRIKRCGQIMGRAESDSLTAAQIFYPCMQCNDVFMLRSNITSLGMDQRKVNMLAREFAEPKNNVHGILDYITDEKTGKVRKPTILSHHMLGALDGDDKMSKSKPDSAIFMEDSESEVNRKISRAFCPPQATQIEAVDKSSGEKKILKNGCLEYIKMIVLPQLGEMTIKTTSGEIKTYKAFHELQKDYLDGTLHPGDVKPALARDINILLGSVRQHFETDPTAVALLTKMKQYMAERKAAAKAGSSKKGKGKGKNKGGGQGKNKGGSKKPAGPKPIFDTENTAVISCLDIRVGKITTCKLHPSADTLYIEEIDVGDETNRTVASGLVHKVAIEDMSGLCVVVCNLKARKMKGVKSTAMVLAAVGEDGTTELLRPPVSAKVGERLTFDGIDMSLGGIATPNSLNKGDGRKALEAILNDVRFTTNSSREATFRGCTMVAAAGEVTVKSVINGKIK
jgi:tyrosyl-tRNA synthetase